MAGLGASCPSFGRRMLLEYRRLNFLGLQTGLVSLDNLAGKSTALPVSFAFIDLWLNFPPQLVEDFLQGPDEFG